MDLSTDDLYGNFDVVGKNTNMSPIFLNIILGVYTP